MDKTKTERGYFLCVFGKDYCKERQEATRKGYLAHIVTGKEGDGEAVLIRAIEIVEGRHVMKRLRGIRHDDDRRIAGGPGKLAVALAISRKHNARPLSRNWLFVANRTEKLRAGPVKQTGRIGIGEGKNLKLRYILEGSRALSVK